MALTATEQKQIREALCAISVRGERFPGESKQARERLTEEFEALKAAAAQPAGEGKK